jgi:acetylornithine deacetylase/succinyl-diaminopimelate desuccinylase-like protein
MLCAHSDTRPPDEGERTSAVEAPSERDGSISGLGAASKGALAAMVVVLERLRASNALARGAVSLAVLIDREGEALGAEDLVRSPVRADAALVAEPTENRLCVGHPGVECLEISFAASAASPGFGPDALMAAVRFVQGLADTLIPSFSQNAHPRLGQPSLVVRGLHCDRPMLGSSRGVVTMATLDHVPVLTDERAPVVRAVTEAIRRVRGDGWKSGVLTSWSDAGMLSLYGGLPVALLGPGKPPDVQRRRDTVSVHALHEAACLYAAAAQAFCEGMAPGQASLV